jgi:hypothetical protein
MTLFIYEIIKTKHILFWRHHLFEIAIFRQCHYQAKIISKEETEINLAITGGYIMMIKYMNK